MRTILQSCLKLAALLPLAMGTAIAQDFDDVVINITPVAGGVSYIEGRGGNIGSAGRLELDSPRRQSSWAVVPRSRW